MKKNIFISLAMIIFIIILFYLFPKDYTNSIGMTFKNIPSGNFIMGVEIAKNESCPKDSPFTNKNEYTDCINSLEQDRLNFRKEIPAHKVNVNSFYMSETEVTQAQWYEIMGNNPSPSYYKNGNKNMPVTNVSWIDTQIFINKLNEREKTTKYRLPTEEEWDYVTKIGEQEWFIMYYSTIKPVKSNKANTFGVYDMNGNAYEWTNSCCRQDYNAIENCEKKVVRFVDGEKILNRLDVNIRSCNAPDESYDWYGFRIVMMK